MTETLIFLIFGTFICIICIFFFLSLSNYFKGTIYYNGLEYEFDIDAVSGKIVKWDVDRD